MTTKAQSDAYEAAHAQRWGGRQAATFNPHGKPVAELPAIYGFNNGGSSVFQEAVLIAEDGTLLGSHACSSEAYMPSDLGIVEGSRPDRHETFSKHYPDGYRMEFVRYDDVASHAGLQAAFKLQVGV